MIALDVRVSRLSGSGISHSSQIADISYFDTDADFTPEMMMLTPAQLSGFACLILHNYFESILIA